jgi:hypothetical protein
MAVSKTLRDIKSGRPVHGCMGGMVAHHAHSHSHEVNEVEELMANPEELTFEFTLVVSNNIYLFLSFFSFMKTFLSIVIKNFFFRLL